MGRFAEPKELEYDPSPEAYCDIVYDARGIGHVVHGMSFDHRYGPEDEKQIEFWRKKGYPGAEQWKVGEPIKAVNAKKANAEMARKQKEG